MGAKRMVNEVQKFTKITFAVHLIIGAIFTILYWIPDISGPLLLVSYTSTAGALSMIIGSATLGLTVSSLFGCLAKEWKEVKLIVITEIVWLVAALIAIIANFTVFQVGMGAFTMIIVIAMIAIFLLTYLQQEEIIGELIK